MKRKSIISLLIFCMGLGMFTTSCEDMLSPNSERHSYKVAQDTLYSYWGILKSLQNIAERYVILNEVRGDLVDASSHVSDTINALVNFGMGVEHDLYKDGACAYIKASDFYHVINSCNAYIARCDTDRILPREDKKYMIREYAQVEAIRAWVYIQLVNTYGEVPFYLEPMLTTDDINKFMNDPNQQKANASNLADLLADRLIPMEALQNNYDEGYPQYNNYGDLNEGNSNYICHSTKCMFPAALVLGDLYLMKGRAGEKESFEKAAQHYFQYINTKECGPLSTGYYHRGHLSEGEEDIEYKNASGNVPFTEKAKVDKTHEAITCIPSNKGKLDGKVLTDINRLFGFEASIRSSGSGDESSSSVTLSFSGDFFPELVASKGYEALCDSQQYEVYLAEKVGNDINYQELVVLPGVGDARRSWIYADNGKQFTKPVGDNTWYGKLITKQNPSRGFTTTYPMVYRKATVWLRYAEALNRAGFHTYAFAILKNGLCNNDEWYPGIPENERTYELEDGTNYASYVYYPYTTIKATGFSAYEYDVKDSSYVYNGMVNDTTDYVLGIEEIISSYDELVARVNQKEQEIADQKNLEEGRSEDDLIMPKPIDDKRVYVAAVSFQNYTTTSSLSICNYISLNERKKAAVTPWMNYEQQYLKATSQAYSVEYKSNLYNRSVNTDASWAPTKGNDYFVTTGIHSRGCGHIRYTDNAFIYDPARKLYKSVYNYVDQVAKKVKENTGKELTTDDIYSSQYEQEVTEAVEDLIIDEMGLELAFEGTRFFDLSRVAMRRNDPTYLAKRVAKRSGEMNMSLYNYLTNMDNWWLPILP